MSTEQKLREDEIFEALKARFAKAWWDGYRTGVEDVESGEETPNPWETL